MLKSKNIKRLIGWAVFILFCGVTLLLIIKASLPTPDKYGTDYQGITFGGYKNDITQNIVTAEGDTTVLESEELCLMLAPDTTVKILQKSTGRIYETALSPEAAQSFVEESADMQSSVVCEYQNDSINTAVMYSSKEAVERKQYKITLSDDGKTVQIEYIFGEKADGSLIPKAVRKEFFEKEILKKLDSDDREYMERRYTLYEYSKLTVYDDPDALLAEYSGLKSNPLYILTDIPNDRVRKKTLEILEKVGYTSEDLAKDNEASGVKQELEIPVFHISLRYRLEGSQLILTVPEKELLYTKSYPLRTLTVNKFFVSSAGSEGSFLVPSGSGALMNFNKNISQGLYEMQFYGGDATRGTKESSEEMLSNTQLSLPVYGMISGNEGVLTVVEQGAEVAELVVKRNENSAFAYTKLNVLQSDSVYLRGAKTSEALAFDDLDSDYVVRYCFMDNLSGEGYADMAALYRQLLIKKGDIKDQDKNENPAVMLELIGGARLQKQVFGLYSKYETAKLTDFNEMLFIANDFKSAGIENLNVSINGFTDSGIYSQLPKDISASKALGGQKGLHSLIDSLKEQGITPYLNVAHQYYYNGYLGDGYNKKMTASFADRSTATLTQYDAVSGFYLEKSLKTQIISPQFYKQIANAYIKTDYQGFALGTLGQDINSDYREESFYDRTRALKAIEATLEAYTKSGKSLTSNDVNAYALKYLSLCENVPTDSGGNIQFAKSIPFKQMVLHGSVPYTMHINTAQTDFTADVLTAIETGSGIGFTLAQNVPEGVLDSDYSYLYSMKYDSVRSRAIEAAQNINKALYGLGNVPITAHSRVGDISRTEYQNGTVIYVNHGTETATIDGVSVPAKGYIRN